MSQEFWLGTIALPFLGFIGKKTHDYFKPKRDEDWYREIEEHLAEAERLTMRFLEVERSVSTLKEDLKEAKDGIQTQLESIIRKMDWIIENVFVPIKVAKDGNN